MAKESLREHLNRRIKEKGSTLSKEKAKAKKYKSIAAAKKDGALYYTNKAGKVMAAVYATDLALKSSLKPKLRPKPTPKPAPKTKPSVPVQPSGGGDKPKPKPKSKPQISDDARGELSGITRTPPGGGRSNPGQMSSEQYNKAYSKGGIALKKKRK